MNLGTGSTVAGPRRRRGKLMYSVLGVMLLATFIPLILTVWLMVNMSEDSLEVQWIESQSDTSRALALEINNHFDLQRARVERIRSSLEWGRVLGRGNEMFRRLLNGDTLSRYINDDMVFLRITDTGSRSSDFVNHRLPLLASSLEQELTQAKEAGMQNRESISDPVLLDLGSGQEAFVILGFPLHSGNQVLGTLEIILSLQKLREPVERWAKARGFTVILTDRQGNVFLQSGASMSSKGEHPVIDAFVLQIRKSPNSAAQVTMPYRAIGNDLKPIDMRGAYFSLPKYNQWGIILEMEQAKAFGAIVQMKKNSVYIGLGALALAVIASFLFATYLTKPIKDLTATAEALASGDFSRKAQVRSSNELGILAETFNKMSSDMQATIEQLKGVLEENQKMFFGTVRVLAAAIDAKDPYTRGHSERVMHYSMAIGKHMKLTDKETEILQLGSLLHDVGKIGIADKILGKPGQLTDEEFEIMKTHPEKGAIIMSKIEPLRDIIAPIRYHHERWAGGGYPTGVSGEHIPKLARIVAVADTFDAMTTERPYQKGMDYDFAVAKIYELRESKYDPDVVEALVIAYRAGDIKKGLKGMSLGDDE